MSKLEAANSNRTAVERLAKWLITIGVTVALAFAGIFFSHGGNPPQH